MKKNFCILLLLNRKEQYETHTQSRWKIKAHCGSLMHVFKIHFSLSVAKRISSLDTNEIEDLKPGKLKSLYIITPLGQNTN